MGIGTCTSCGEMNEHDRCVDCDVFVCMDCVASGRCPDCYRCSWTIYTPPISNAERAYLTFHTTGPRELVGRDVTGVAVPYWHELPPLEQQRWRAITREDTTEPRVAATINGVLSFVSGYLSVSVDDILSDKRHQPLASRRHLAMWLARQVTEAPLSELARCFHRDHSTIDYACRKIDAAIDADEPLGARAQRLLVLWREELATGTMSAAASGTGTDTGTGRSGSGSGSGSGAGLLSATGDHG